jgi:hypothetical protein
VSRQTFAAADGAQFPPASHAAVANTVTRTNLWVPALWTFINAFDPVPNRVYTLRCGGIISTTATPTIVFNPTFGQSATPASNIALGATTTWTLGTLSNAPWWAEFTLGFRQIGVAASTATCTGNGYVIVGGAAAAVGQCVPMGGTVVTTADHTTAQGMCLDVTWGTASVSNTITAQWSRLYTEN